jgi:hypothetical protein
MNSPKTACNYALLRFLPYPETGEFVNIGVVLFAPGPDRQHLIVAIPAGDVARVLHFFPTVRKDDYLLQKSSILEEIDRVHDKIWNSDERLGRTIFAELVRPRESIFRFSDMRTVLSDDPPSAAMKIHEHIREQFNTRALAAS